jgi:hypothetical protein
MRVYPALAQVNSPKNDDAVVGAGGVSCTTTTTAESATVLGLLPHLDRAYQQLPAERDAERRLG